MTKKSNLMTVLAAVLVLAMIGSGSWLYAQQISKNKANQQKISDLEKEVTSLKDKPSNQKEDIESYLNIVEFRLKVKLDQNTKDAYYLIETYQNEDGSTGRSAMLSTRSLTQQDYHCEPHQGSSGSFKEDGSFLFPQGLCSDGSLSQLEQQISNSFKEAPVVKY